MERLGALAPLGALPQIDGAGRNPGVNGAIRRWMGTGCLLLLVAIAPETPLVGRAWAQTNIVYVDDFGANGNGVVQDHFAIQAALDAAGQGGVVRFTPGRAYVVCKGLKPRAFQRLEGHGATIRRCDSVQSELTAPVPAGSNTVQVQDASGFEEGMLVTPVSAPDRYGGEAAFNLLHPITEIAGNTIQFQRALGRGYEAGDLLITANPIIGGTDPFSAVGLTLDGNRRKNSDYIAWNYAPSIWYWGNGALLVSEMIFVDTWADAVWPSGNGSSILDSVFDGAGGSAIHFSSAYGTEISGNVFRNLNREAALAGHSPAAVTWSNRNENITLADNCFENLHEGALGVISFAKNRGANVARNRACGARFFFAGGIYSNPLPEFTPTGFLLVQDNLVVDAGTSFLSASLDYAGTLFGMEFKGNTFVRSDMWLEEALMVDPIIVDNEFLSEGECSCAGIQPRACSNGYDDDGDGLVDFPGDPGCSSTFSTHENPQCQDGINNDPLEDLLVDFDGGLSALGYVVSAPDPRCLDMPWKNQEGGGRACGLGFEVAFLVPSLWWLHRRMRFFPVRTCKRVEPTAGFEPATC